MKGRCRDCRCHEGELHAFGCDMERCPFCGGQLISCECIYRELHIEITLEVEANGVTDEQWDKWLAMCTKKGRVPYVQVPILCAMCGEVWPEFFSVSTRTWKKYVIPELQKEVLCWPCFKKQRALFPNGWRAAKQVVA